MTQQRQLSDQELLALAKEAESELDQQYRGRSRQGRRDMVDYFELDENAEPSPDEMAEVGLQARQAAIGLGAIAMGAMGPVDDPRVDMEVAEVFHEVANLAEEGKKSLGKAGDEATKWVEENPEKAGVAIEMGAMLMSEGEGNGREDMAAMYGRNDMAGMYGRNDMAGMYGRNDMAPMPGYGALRGGFGRAMGTMRGGYDRLQGLAGRGMDYGVEGAMRGAGGLDAAAAHVARNPWAYGIGGGALGGAGLGYGGAQAMDYFGDDRMDMAGMYRADMMPMDRMNMMPMDRSDMGPLDFLRGAGGMARGGVERGMDYGVEGAMRGAGGLDAAYGMGRRGLAEVQAHPRRYGGLAAGGAAVGGGGYLAGRMGDDRQDMALDMRKGEIWKKIAAAAGIGAVAAGGAAAGGAAAASAGRSDMESLKEAPAEGQGAKRTNMEALQERDDIFQKALQLDSTADYKGMTARQILETVYKSEENVKDIPTERLKNRLDMEIDNTGNAREYVASGGTNEAMPRSLEASGGLAMALRRLGN